MTNLPPQPYESPVKQGDIMDLDWRKAPSQQDMMRTAWNWVMGVDISGSSKMIASSGMNGRQWTKVKKGDKNKTKVSRGAQLVYLDKDKNIIAEEEADALEDSVRAWIYKAYFSVRKGRSLCKYARVWRKMVQMVDKGAPECKRNAGYDLDSRTFPKAAGLRCYQDLCLTMGIHPSAFGIHADGDGAVYVPEGFKINAVVCKNVFTYSNSKVLEQPERVDKYKFRGLQKKTFSGQSDHIDAMIESLQVKHTATSNGEPPRCVIVTEHRNIKQVLENVIQSSTGDDWKGVFVVMTGGMPSLATREFLHMLSKDPLLADVPFLFISDHDLHAIEIFSVLKQGSRSTAFTSLTTICPQLHWAGVSFDRYKALALAWPAWELERRTRGRNRITTSEKAALLKSLKEERDRRLFKPLETATAYLNAADRQLMKHFHSYKMFCPQRDAELYSDLLTMGMNEYDTEPAVKEDARGYKFSLAKLGDPNTYGVENCFLVIMKQYGVRDAVNSQVQLPAMTPAQLQWLAQESQFEPIRGSSQGTGSGHWSSYLAAEGEDEHDEDQEKDELEMYD